MNRGGTDKMKLYPSGEHVSRVTRHRISANAYSIRYHNKQAPYQILDGQALRAAERRVHVIADLIETNLNYHLYYTGVYRYFTGSFQKIGVGPPKEWAGYDK